MSKTDEIFEFLGGRAVVAFAVIAIVVCSIVGVALSIGWPAPMLTVRVVGDGKVAAPSIGCVFIVGSETLNSARLAAMGVSVGSKVSLRAYPGGANVFAGWTSGPCDRQPETCTFLIGLGPTKVTAYFVKR